jgi:DNA-binding transcriptional regulator YdaS (Cro superfamily)
LSTLSTTQRAALLALIRAGRITVSEAAALAGVSRQAVSAWCRRARIDAAAARARYLAEAAAEALLEPELDWREGRQETPKRYVPKRYH